MASSRARAVLVVEDDVIVAHDLQHTLADLGYDAFAVAASADEALARSTEKRPDIVLMDIRIRGPIDGVGTARLLQERFSVPVVYLTAHADDTTLQRAKRTRPYGYLVKPVQPAELKSAIEVALFNHDTEKTSREVPTPARGVTALRGPARLSRAPGSRVVRRQVEQILASGDFDASQRSREFLRFIVEEALAGRGDDLTQAAIATRVFGRKDDFDAVVDPIVRIQAGRLRRSLERYYLLSGKDDALRIELPRGAYVPVFHAQAAVEPKVDEEPPPEPPPQRSPAADPAFGWPCVAVESFESALAGTELEPAAARLREELVLELGRYRDVRPLLQEELDRLEATRREGVRFSLGARLWQQDGELRVSTRLVDRTTGEQMWGDDYHTASRPNRWSGSPDDLARVIAARVGAEEGVIVQALAGERRRSRPGPITPFGAMLLAYDFFLARDPEAVAPALQALRQVVHAEPDCGPAWTRLSRLYSANHTFEVTPIPTPIDDAITYAHIGVRLDPISRRARCVLASALMIKGELAAARHQLDQALRLANDSLVYLEVIGYLLSMLGDEPRGPELIRTARERNPHCLPHGSIGMWFHYFRNGELELAYQEALQYRDPTFFWRALMRTCCLAHLGRAAEAQVELADLLRRKPDFAQRGRVLIGHYIKFPEVTSLIVDGLAKAGLQLA